MCALGRGFGNVGRAGARSLPHAAFLWHEAAMRWFILAPVLLLLVLFALSNTGPTRIGLWPTGWSLDAPLSLIILGFAAVAFLCGGLLVWIAELGQRQRARRAEHAVRQLEAQVQDLKARLPQPVPEPPVA
jgi:putative membrane protein